jgi:hypothetical protein
VSETHGAELRVQTNGSTSYIWAINVRLFQKLPKVLAELPLVQG